MSNGFGKNPWGAGPYGVPGLDPSPEQQAALSSSRLIDGVTRRYVVADDGGFEAMDDIAQRVQLLLAYSVKETDIITPQENRTMEARIRDALTPLTKRPTPSIRILELVVEDQGGARSFKSLKYKNLLTGTQQTLMPNGQLLVNGQVQ